MEIWTSSSTSFSRNQTVVIAITDQSTFYTRKQLASVLTSINAFQKKNEKAATDLDSKDIAK